MNKDQLIRVLYHTLRENGYDRTCNELLRETETATAQKIHQTEYLQAEIFNKFTKTNGDGINCLNDLFQLNFGMILGCKLKNRGGDSKNNREVNNNLINAYKSYDYKQIQVSKKPPYRDLLNQQNHQLVDHLFEFRKIFEKDFSFIQKYIININVQGPYVEQEFVEMYADILCFIFYKLVRITYYQENNGVVQKDKQSSLLPFMFFQHVLLVLQQIPFLSKFANTTNNNNNNNNNAQSAVLLSMSPGDALMYRNKYFQYDIIEPKDGDYFVKYLVLKYLENDIFVPKNYLESLLSSSLSKTSTSNDILQYPMVKKSIETNNQPVPNINNITIDINLKGMTKTNIFDYFLQSQKKNKSFSKTVSFKSTKNNFLQKTPVSSGSCVFSNNGKLVLLTYRVDVQDEDDTKSNITVDKYTDRRSNIELLYYDEFQNKCEKITSFNTQYKESFPLGIAKKMEWYSEYFTKVLFSPDNRYLGLFSNIGTLYIYQIDYQELQNYYRQKYENDPGAEKIEAENTKTFVTGFLKMFYNKNEDEIGSTNFNDDVSMDAENTTGTKQNMEIQVDGVYSCFDWLDNKHVVMGSLNNNNMLIVDVEKKKIVFNNNKSHKKCISPVPIEKIFVLNTHSTSNKIHKKLIIVSPSSILLENFNNISYKSTPQPDTQTIVFENSNAEMETGKTTGKTKTETQFQKPTTAVLCYDIVQPVEQYLHNLRSKPTADFLFFKPTNIFQINAVVTSVAFPTSVDESLPYCLVNTIDDEVQVWDYSIGVRVAKYYGAENYQQIKIVPTFLGENSEFVLCGSEQGKLLIWNRYNGNFIGVIETDQGTTTAVLANPVYKNHFISFHDNTAFCDWSF